MADDRGQREVDVTKVLLHPLLWLVLSVLAYEAGWMLACGLLFCVFLFTAMGRVGGRG